MRASPPTTWLARPSTMAGRVAPAMGLGHSQWWAGAFASPPNPTRRPAHTGPWAQPHNTQATDMPQSPSSCALTTCLHQLSNATLTSRGSSRMWPEKATKLIVDRCADAPRARLTQSGTSCHAAEHRCRADGPRRRHGGRPRRHPRLLSRRALALALTLAPTPPPNPSPYPTP